MRGMHTNMCRVCDHEFVSTRGRAAGNPARWCTVAAGHTAKCDGQHAVCVRCVQGGGPPWEGDYTLRAREGRWSTPPGPRAWGLDWSGDRAGSAFSSIERGGVGTVVTWEDRWHLHLPFAPKPWGPRTSTSILDWLRLRWGGGTAKPQAEDCPSPKIWFFKKGRSGVWYEQKYRWRKNGRQVFSIPPPQPPSHHVNAFGVNAKKLTQVRTP